MAKTERLLWGSATKHLNGVYEQPAACFFGGDMDLESLQICANKHGSHQYSAIKVHYQKAKE